MTICWERVVYDTSSAGEELFRIAWWPASGEMLFRIVYLLGKSCPIGFPLVSHYTCRRLWYLYLFSV